MNHPGESSPGTEAAFAVEEALPVVPEAPLEERIPVVFLCAAAVWALLLAGLFLRWLSR